ncbi:hypothetical protein PTTG_12193 [Puccinia triticina 1-1 BBBD Race 1]|uniref:Uncharacterized protein n=1 Tax=Puccinia triticina (isolate 1-1 / race 1 (BBBD)) TaxID=630390 RepID=A0A180H2T7_PUCT1|nr:hypothetical protein PTTG_12193 [Puccinia triticina 1-1 BBBD Race 1]
MATSNEIDPPPEATNLLEKSTTTDREKLRPMMKRALPRVTQIKSLKFRTMQLRWSLGLDKS